MSRRVSPPPYDYAGMIRAMFSKSRSALSTSKPLVSAAAAICQVQGVMMKTEKPKLVQWCKTLYIGLHIVAPFHHPEVQFGIAMKTAMPIAN